MGGGGRVGGWGGICGGGQDGCERRIEVFLNIKKNKGGGVGSWGGGVGFGGQGRLDVIREVKFL